MQNWSDVLSKRANLKLPSQHQIRKKDSKVKLLPNSVTIKAKNNSFFYLHILTQNSNNITLSVSANTPLLHIRVKGDVIDELSQGLDFEIASSNCDWIFGTLRAAFHFWILVHSETKCQEVAK